MVTLGSGVPPRRGSFFCSRFPPLELAGYCRRSLRTGIRDAYGSLLLTALFILHNFSFFSVEVDEQIGRFIDSDTMVLGLLQFGFETLPDGDGEIFRRRNAGEKFGYFFVQEAMVHGVEHFAMHDFLELLEIDDEAGAGIDLAPHGDFEGVVMAVAVGVVALAEDAAVLLGREVGVVVIVRRGELGFAG